MASKICDSYVAPFLIPAIMSVSLYKIPALDANDSGPLYPLISMGTIISAISTMIQFRIKRFFIPFERNKRSSRLRLIAAIMTAILLTSIPILTIISFNMMRMSSSKFNIPNSINSTHLEQLTMSETIVENLISDIPISTIIFLQSIFSMLIMDGLCHKTKRYFSFGEASIVTQLSSTALSIYTLDQYSYYYGFEIKLPITYQIVLTIGSIIFFVSFVIPYSLNMGSSTLALGAFISLSLAIIHNQVQKLILVESDLDPLTWLTAYLTDRHQRISLFIIWAATLTACMSLSASWARLVGQTNCLIRKTFHVAICIVFISGYNQDLEFTSFAAGGILCIMFLLELCRAWDLKMIGPYLENICGSLRGGWDNKYLTVSHIYLLVGVFVPIWLLPKNSTKLAISSGLISVGVGDTAAAVVGTFMGKTPIFPRSKKTMEGFLGNFIAMFLFKQAWIGNQDFPSELAFFYVSIITSIVEVITNNCDNLILPLVMTLLNIVFFW